jgi:hypothetical protein
MNGSHESTMSGVAPTVSPIILTETKRCSKCGEIRAVTEFCKTKKGKGGRVASCRICDRERTKQWRICNPEKYKAMQAAYRKEHKVELAAYNAVYRKQHPGTIQKDNERKKLWKKNNPERHREICRKHHLKTYDSEKECRRLKEYRERDIEKAREGEKNRRSTPTGSLNRRMSVSIRKSVVKGKGGHRWEALVGYTVEQLRGHLENLFCDGMDWGKFCRGEIHIDHVRPQSSFHFESPSDPEFRVCWGLENLQPLWGVDNMRKHAKIDVNYGKAKREGTIQ